MDEHTKRRFLGKIMAVDGCWEWTANISPGGYGRFKVANRTEYAHRVSYELFVGPIPDGLQIDHLCRNRKCVRPDHLEPVTARDNLLRGKGPTARNAAKTRCPHGHPYDEENTITYRDQRYCRSCHRERCKRRRELAAVA